MNIFEILMIGIGLSMDAFAVSICKGLCMNRFYKTYALVLALFFGGFQALMPLLGWLLGSAFYSLVSSFGSVISFLLLVYVGGKMIYDGILEFRHPEAVVCELPRIHIKEFLFLSIATSIDAFAVGVTFSLLSVNILFSICLIGITTFILSLVAIFIGFKIGNKIGTYARLTGGGILALLGIKILLTSFLS